MGYYVRIDDVNWEIKETPESLSAVREMPKKFKGIQRGGSSSGERWFSWMNDAEIESAETVEAVFNHLGFETEKTVGGFKILGYDSKTGQEDLFLGYLAPYTEHDSYIEWVGEDDARWRNRVEHGRMFVDEAETTWKTGMPYQYYHIAYVRNEPKQMLIDPLGADVDSKVQLAEEWHADNQAYYAELREEREKAEALTTTE